MAEIVSFAGQKGGTGKSMLAQAFALEAVLKGRNTVLADLDVGQRTSFEWSEARMRNELMPHVQVVVVDPSKHESDFGVQHLTKQTDIVVVDAPGWSDEKTKLLAGYSDLMILPTGASLADMRPTIRLMHELIAKGIQKNQICTALCRVKSAGEIKFARDYIKQAGYQTLPGMLRDMPTYRSLQNEGKAAIEADAKTMKSEARELISSIHANLEKIRSRSHDKPERFELQPERFVLEGTKQKEKKTQEKRRRR
ncbi:MAG: ParA family protein [Pseudomonadota bacterium]